MKGISLIIVGVAALMAVLVCQLHPSAAQGGVLSDAQCEELTNECQNGDINSVKTLCVSSLEVTTFNRETICTGFVTLCKLQRNNLEELKNRCLLLTGLETDVSLGR